MLSLFCPARQWAQVPLLLPQGAAGTLKRRAGHGRAEPETRCNQERKQQDLEGPGCRYFPSSSHQYALQREMLLVQCVGTALYAGEAETRVWGHLLTGVSSPVCLELAGSLDVWVFTPQTALWEEKRLFQVLAPQWVPAADLPRLLPAAHPSTEGCLRTGSAPGVCRLR